MKNIDCEVCKSEKFFSDAIHCKECKKPNLFELYGYDFLIDEDFRTWLVEVNTNPYLGIPNKFVQHGDVKTLYSLCGYDEEAIINEGVKICEQ